MAAEDSASVSLAEQIDILFEYGASRGLNTTYRAIAEATGESPSNLHKIHQGINDNPGLKLLRSLTDYFGIELAYFDCRTEADCRRYLKQRAEDEVMDEVAMRAGEISHEGLRAIREMISYVKRAEGIDGEDESE